MALIEPFMIKSAIGVGADTAVELTADTGESLLIKDVIVKGSDDEYVVFEIGKTTVGFFRVDNGKAGSHLAPNMAFANKNASYYGLRASRSITLLNYMIEKGWMSGYPVAEGQTFRVKPYTSGKKLGNIFILYEKYDAGDIKKDMPNGSEATEYVFVNYGYAESDLTSGGDYEVNYVRTTKEFIDFPFGDAVPAKHEVDILAICATEACDWDASDTYTYTKYLKLFKGRRVLFDDDRNGLLFYYPPSWITSAGTYFGKGISVLGNYSDKDRREPFVLPTPLHFVAGDELKVYITAGQGTNAAVLERAFVEVAMIEKVKVAE